MTCYAKFYAYSDLSYIVTAPGTYDVLKASYDQKLLMIGTGNCTIPVQSTMSPQIFVGKYCCVYTYDNATAGDVIVSQFFVEKAGEAFQLGGKFYSELSGSSIESELDKIRAYGEVGLGNSYIGETKYGQPNKTDFFAETFWESGDETTLVQTLHRTQSDAAVADNSMFAVDDTIHFKKDTGWPQEQHVATVTNVYNDGSYDRVVFTPALGSGFDCENGQPVVKGFGRVGGHINIPIADNKPTHFSYIVAIGAAWGEYTIADPLPHWVSVGVSYSTGSAHLPASSDFRQLIDTYAGAYGWDDDATYDSGTTNGTAWRMQGQSIRSMLEAMQKASGGEFWRITYGAAGGPPVREISWHRTSDASGKTIRLKTANDQHTDYADTAICVPIVPPVYRETFDAISHITPYGVGGPGAGITLEHMTDSVPAGYTLEQKPNRVYILSKDSTAAIYHNHSVLTFPNVEPAQNTDDDREVASNLLFQTTKNYLDVFKDNGEVLLECTTIVHGEVEIGQTISVDITSLDVAITGTYYIVGINHWVDSNEKGGYIRYTRLTMSERLWPNKTAQDFLMQAVRNSGNITADGIAGPVASLPGGGGSGGIDTDDFLHADGSVDLTGNLAVDSGITIDGVDISAHAVDYDAHHTPGTLTAGTSNDVSTGTEYHAITSTADGDTNPTTILSSSANGGLRLDRLGINTAEPASSILAIDGDLSFIGAQSISTTADDLGISPAGNLILTPAGEFVTLGAGAVDPTIKTDDWASGFLGTGWGVDHTGHGDFRSLYADELHVTHFTAEHLRVKSGGEWITPSTSTLTADMTVPAVSATTTIYVDDVPGLQAMPVFAENDYVLLRVFDNTAGAMNIFNVWGQVTSYVDQGDGTQAWTFTTRSASQTGDVIKQGSTVVDFGQSGDGGIFLNAVDEAGAPYIDMFRWYTNPYTAANRTHPIRLGDLGGTGAEIKGVMGLFIGDIAGKYMVFSERKAEMHGIGLSLYDHADDNGYLRFDYIRVAVDYDGGTDNMDPNADVATVGDFSTSIWSLVTSTGTTYYNLIDNATSPDGAWVGNAAGKSATLLLDLESMTSSFSNTIKVTVSGYVVSNGGNGNLRVLVDILDNLGERITTTGELANETTGAGVTSVELRPLKILTEADWDDAIINIGWVFTPSGLATKVIELDPETPKIAIYPDTSLSYYDQKQAYSFEYSDGSLLGGVFSRVSATTAYTGVESYVPSAGLQATAILRSVAGGSGDEAVTYIAASGNAGVDVADITLESDDGSGNRRISTTSDLFEVTATDGISLQGETIIDQLGLDNAILQLRSSEVTGMTTQGMSHANTYFQIAKTNATEGGALVRAGSESVHALWMAGSANTATTTLSTAGIAPVILAGYVDDTSVGAGNNAVAFKSGTLTRWIMRGNGDVYMDGVDNESNWDEYDDHLLIRAGQKALGMKGIIQNRWDELVEYNKDDLEETGLVVNGFMHQQGWIKLFAGAHWQGYGRMNELEERIAALEGTHETK